MEKAPCTPTLYCVMKTRLGHLESLRAWKVLFRSVNYLPIKWPVRETKLLVTADSITNPCDVYPVKQDCLNAFGPLYPNSSINQM